MKKLGSLSPAPVWEIFEMICSIPHPSGHEAALAEALAAAARERGLAVRRDAAGNLRIDRAAAPGFESAPVVLLQAHLDMVPQTAPGVTFDFLTDPIPPEIRGEWVVSGAGTTLGSDNGIGVAAAVALLFDPAWRGGALAGVFTVSEEVGLNGALALSPEMLEGTYLLNLDSEEEGELYLGCAGGARLTLTFDASFRPVPAGMTGVRCTVGGMAGGHSGCNIADRRGNAIRLLARLLERSPELLIASFDGGTCDNAIPREAAVCGALPADGVDRFRARAEAFAREAAGEFDAPPEFRIVVESAPLPERVWREEFRARVLGALTGCSDGVVAYDSALGVVRTSSNLASVRSEGERLVVATSQRSLIDAERAALTDAIADRFRAAGAAAAVSHAYPGWEPRQESRLFSTAASLYRELFGKRPEPKVIHAGLECGILSGINPKLEILSFGPTLENPHSPGERLDIASVGRFWKFLRELILRLQSSPRP